MSSNQKFKKSLLAVAIVCSLTVGPMALADNNLSSTQLRDLDSFLQDISEGKSVSVDVSSDKPVVPPSDVKKEVKTETEQKQVVPVKEENNTKKEVDTNKDEDVKAKIEEKKEEQKQEDKKVDEILEKSSNQKKEESNDVVNIMNGNDNIESNNDNTNKIEEVVKKDTSKTEVEKYLDSKKAIKEDIENGTAFNDTDVNEDLDYVKEKSHIIELERKAREDELKKLAAIKYVEKTENVPLNNYLFSVTFNENKFFKIKVDRSNLNFKQYILTANQKEALAPDSLPKDDLAKGYKNISTVEVNNEGSGPQKYELGVKYIIQILQFDIDNNRIQIRVDANNSEKLAEYNTFDNKSLKDSNTKFTKTYASTETFWIPNTKNSKKVILLGNDHEVVISLDDIVKNTESITYKVVDPTDGKAAENEKLLKEQAEKTRAAEEAKKVEDAKVKEDAVKKEEKEKGFFGRFF